MGNCGFPPGLGVGPSVFPTKKVYDTYEVTYTTVNGIERPTSVVYKDTTGATITTVTITYDSNGDPIWNGYTLKHHQFNVFKAEFELFDPSSSSAATEGPSSQDTLSLSDSSVTEVKVGVSALTGRKVVTVQCTTGNVKLWFGVEGDPAPSVATVSTDGLTIFKNSKETYEAVANQPLYAVSVDTTASLILVERA